MLVETVPTESDGEWQGIIQEMCFFGGLVVVNEIFRRCLTLRPALAQSMLITSYVLAWFTVSITLILYNKWVIASWNGGMSFPISYTTGHMFFKGVFAFVFILFRGKPWPRFDWRVLAMLSFVGAMAALDIAASNMSLLYISASYYTFLKSSSLLFILLFAFITCLEPFSPSIVTTVVLISVGMALCSYGEIHFSVKGFVLVMSSEVFSALRWIVTEMTIKNKSWDLMAMVFYMAPASTLTLAPIAFVSERSEITKFHDARLVGELVGFILFPAFLAFLLLLVEMMIIHETSSLSLTVFGNVKSVVTIIFAMIVFGEQTTLPQWCGMAVAISGMTFYAHARGDIFETRNALQSDAATTAEREPIGKSVEGKLSP